MRKIELNPIQHRLSRGKRYKPMTDGNTTNVDIYGGEGQAGTETQHKRSGY